MKTDYEKRKIVNEALNYVGDECLFYPLKLNGPLFTRLYVLVCEQVHGLKPPPTSRGERYGVAHSCGNGHLGCCNPKHLRWATQRENMLDSAKLTKNDVLEIRRLLSQSALTKREIAVQFNVDRQTIIRINNRRQWWWLDD